MTKISVAIIARDRAKEIEACLQSVRGVDEIVVLDTGSVDATPRIALSNKAVVYYYRWDDDFAAARNRVLDYVHHPWVLSIDTDEVLSTGVKSLYDCVNLNFSSKAVGVRIDQPNGSFFGARLFRKDSCHWEREIHEALNRTPDLVTSDIAIKHTPSKDHASDPERNIKILRKTLERTPLSIMDVYYMGYELHTIGKYDAALYWLALFIEISRVTPNFTSEAYYLIADCYCKLHRVGRAIDALIESVKANPQMKASYAKLYQLTRNESWREKENAASNDNVIQLR